MGMINVSEQFLRTTPLIPSGPGALFMSRLSNNGLILDAEKSMSKELSLVKFVLVL